MRIFGRDRDYRCSQAEDRTGRWVSHDWDGAVDQVISARGELDRSPVGAGGFGNDVGRDLDGRSGCVANSYDEGFAARIAMSIDRTDSDGGLTDAEGRTGSRIRRGGEGAINYVARQGGELHCGSIRTGGFSDNVGRHSNGWRSRILN